MTQHQATRVDYLLSKNYHDLPDANHVPKIDIMDFFQEINVKYKPNQTNLQTPNAKPPKCVPTNHPPLVSFASTTVELGHLGDSSNSKEGAFPSPFASESPNLGLFFARVETPCVQRLHIESPKLGDEFGVALRQTPPRLWLQWTRRSCPRTPATRLTAPVGSSAPRV